MKTFLGMTGLLLFSVLLAFSIGCFYNYFYPMRYQEEIVEACQKYDVSPALVASIINVESGYNKDAVSSRGAVGLMQLMPETAQWICSKIGLNYKDVDLTDAQTSIKIGTAYLSILSKTFEDENSMICAYNAGPSKVKVWLADAQNSQDGIVLDNIPYAETNAYLNKVKKNLRYYEKKYV